MSAGPSAAIDSWRGARVLVIGDAMLDRYFFGVSTRIAQEAPVPVVDVSEVEECPGGAGNVAACAAALGARVSVVGAAAHDTTGGILRQSLERMGVETHLAAAPWTLTKSRVSGGDHVLLRFDEGSPFPEDEFRNRTVASAIWHGWQSADLVILSDYGYGLFSAEVLDAVRCLQLSAPRPLAVDARDLRRFAELRPRVVKPNYQQALALAGSFETACSRAAGVVASKGRLLEATGASIVCATLDSAGCAVLTTSGATVVPAPGAGRTFTNGAGDTFLAAFALADFAQLPAEDSARLAIAAASVVVGQPGTRTCSERELRRALGGSARVLAGETDLKRWLQDMRRAGRSVAFTNGVFDLVHAGHVASLEEARSQADVLLVGLNDDESVRRLKGPSRPLNSIQRRMDVLAGLNAVDAVIPFSEDTPLRLLSIVRPDVYVKGGDYSRETLAESPLVESWGGRVHITGYLDGHSTSEIIDRALAYSAAEADR